LESQFSQVGWYFAIVALGAGFILDGMDAVIAEGGDVEQGLKLVGLGEALQLGIEVVVGGEVEGFDGGVRVPESGGLAFEAENWGSLGAEGLGEHDPEFPGREVGEPAHLIDWFKAGAAGDE
jgi:hypothetical protein